MTQMDPRDELRYAQSPIMLYTKLDAESTVDNNTWLHSPSPSVVNSRPTGSCFRLFYVLDFPDIYSALVGMWIIVTVLRLFVPVFICTVDHSYSVRVRLGLGRVIGYKWSRV